MKGNLLIYLMAMGGVFLSACGDDDSDAAPPHEVGNWNLNGFAITNLPDAFASNENRTLGIGEVRFGGAVVFESYVLDLRQDLTFALTVKPVGRLEDTDEGTWELTDDDFVLDFDDSNDQLDFTLERNENDQLWLSTLGSFILIPDSTFARLFDEFETADAVNNYLNGLTPEERDQLDFEVTLDLVYTFDRIE